MRVILRNPKNPSPSLCASGQPKSVNRHMLY
jgi:hypothetical protein